MAPLSIRLLGGLRIEHDGAPVELGPQRARGLVAYLLVHRDRPHERSHLAYVLWPDSDEAQARTNLRKTLHQLRGSLPDAERLVSMDGRTVGWRREAAYELDLEQLDEAVERAERAEEAGEVDLEREHLEVAARTYRAELLPELYDDWLETERERLHQRCGRVLERLVDVLWQQLDDRAAVAYAQRLVQHDPLVESSHRRLMRLHARSGERAKALHVYHTCASILQERLQIEPSSETLALYEEVLRLEPATEAPASHRAPAPGPTAVASAPLVGRHHELERLRAAWDDAHLGRPGLVFVTGDAGIGKTRLVEDFARSLRRREATVVAARCYATEFSLTLAPVAALLRAPGSVERLNQLEPVWREEVRRLLPELGTDTSPIPEPLTEGWQRRRLFEALARAALASQPLVVIVDDVQWCDGDSLDWLHYLLRFDAHARLLLVATARTHELDGNAQLGALLSAVERDGLLARLELAPLGEDDTATLARSLLGRDPEPDALAELVDQTEGNPLFVVEMVREGTLSGGTSAARGEAHPAPTLPRRLHAVITSRLERLSASSTELLAMAAVIGREFDFDLLVRVSRLGEDVVVQALDELWRARVVRELGAGTYDFSHDKVREVAYTDLSLTRRRLLHRYTAEALEALEALGERDQEGVQARIAFHYDRAGYAERAITHYQLAAAGARRLYAHDEALRAYDRGLELLDELPPTAALAEWRRSVTADLLEGAGDVLVLKGMHHDGRERFGRALEHRIGHDIASARLRRKIGLTWIARYRYDEAARAYASAEAALGGADAAHDAAWWREWIATRLALSGMYYWQLDWRNGKEVLAPMEGSVMQHGTPSQRGAFFRARADMDFIQHRCTVTTEGLQDAVASLAAMQESGSVLALASTRFRLGFAFLWSGDLDQAEEHMTAALATAEATGNAVGAARYATYLCFVHRMRGDVVATERLANQCLAAARQLTMPEYVGAAQGHLAWLAWRGQDDDACRRHGRAALKSWTTGQRYPLQWCARLPLLVACLRQDRRGEAVAHAAALLDPVQQRLPDDLTEALECAVGADPGSAAARRALERSVALAQDAGLL